MSSCPVRPAHDPPLDPSLTVNEVLRRWPAAVTALNAFGIDTCCGGAAPLEAAAGEAGVALGEIVAAIEHAIADERVR